MRNIQLIETSFPAKSMVKSKNDSSNDPKASTDSSTTLEDDDSKGRTGQVIFLQWELWEIYKFLMTPSLATGYQAYPVSAMLPQSDVVIFNLYQSLGRI